VWYFHVGGYQVCEKWLKDHKGRTLSKEDIAHYQKIVVALSETIRLMKEILVNTIASVRAAQNLSPPVAVVMLAINDPVATGLVASLARPGGYTTGMATMNEDLTLKLLDIQREIIPDARTIAVLFNPINPTNPPYVDKLRTAAGAIGMTVQPVELTSPDRMDPAFATIAARHPDTLHIVADAGIIDLHDRVAALALARKLPSFSTLSGYAEFGGLMAYGISLRQLFMRSGYFVKRILDGEKPGDLPVEQPHADRIGDQPQDRQGTWHHGPPDVARDRQGGDRIDWNLLHCICLLLAHSGHGNRARQCPLSGAKRTSPKCSSIFSVYCTLMSLPLLPFKELLEQGVAV
jgi:ABC-type uncharacterized transport system substrate-binding protein